LTFRIRLTEEIILLC